MLLYFYIIINICKEFSEQFKVKCKTKRQFLVFDSIDFPVSSAAYNASETSANRWVVANSVLICSAACYEISWTTRVSEDTVENVECVVWAMRSCSEARRLFG